jgi:hypothetical protein
MGYIINASAINANTVINCICLLENKTLLATIFSSCEETLVKSLNEGGRSGRLRKAKLVA